jgi:Ni/Co efflux regulator RcnB
MTMKRLILSALAAATLVAPAAAPAFADQPQRSGYERNDRDWNDNRDRSWDRNDRNDRYDRDDRRDDRRYQRFDSRYHNGYYVGRTWHYGPPSADAYRMRGFQLGFKPWKRGERLGYYNGRYREVDYRAHRMKAPPRGYHYVQDDRGDIILAAIATGVIAAIIASN